MSKQPNPDTVRIPADLEPYIEAGVKRTKMTRHGYLVAAIKYVAKREKL